MIYLGERRENGPVTLAEVAKQLHIPKAFLSKILQQLTRGGIVQSAKGPTGGFVLCQDPKALSIRTIVEEIEGSRMLFECYADNSNCQHFGKCRILGMFEKVRLEMDRVLDQFVLADFMESEKSDTAAVGMIGVENK